MQQYEHLEKKKKKKKKNNIAGDISRMLGLEEEEEDEVIMNVRGLPPGFRFHPTDEELITYYLAAKVFNSAVYGGVEIAELDLNRCEPWELPESGKIGGDREWYFFSHRDRKYPTGLRTNRATGAGYWKATGKDRQVSSHNSIVIGMKKTLVFYNGRAPRGLKTKWVMHEYRLFNPATTTNTTSKEEWVICRICHKTGTNLKPSLNNHPQQQQQTTNLDCFGPIIGTNITTSTVTNTSSSCQSISINGKKNNSPSIINVNNDIYSLPALPSSFPPPPTPMAVPLPMHAGGLCKSEPFTAHNNNNNNSHSVVVDYQNLMPFQLYNSYDFNDGDDVYSLHPIYHNTAISLLDA